MLIQNESEKSLLRFTPRSIKDFGTLLCFAENRIGRQREPCRFEIERIS